MSDLGQAEFKSLEAAVRDRLSTWTSGIEGLHFAVLDYPSTLERRLSQQLLERGFNEKPKSQTLDKDRLDYLFALDKVVNPVLAGGQVVAPKTETIGKIYGDILKYAQPLPKRLTAEEEAELQEHRNVLYVPNPETGLLDPSSALTLYKVLSQELMHKSLALHQAQVEYGVDSIEARAKQRELDFAQTDFHVRGQKRRIEEAQLRIIQLSTNSAELWREAKESLEKNLFTDAETTSQFPVSVCPPVPDTNWMKIDLDMRSNSSGVVLGLNEKLLRLEAEIFLVPIDRSGWLNLGVLTKIPWAWGLMGRTDQLSDGKGRGGLPYLPQHLVLMRDIKLTVQIPFNGESTAPATQLPKIGRMAVPLQVSAVNGRTVQAQPVANMVMTRQATTPTVSTTRPHDLRQMRAAQLMGQRHAGRTLIAQIASLQRGPAVPAIPKTKASKTISQPLRFSKGMKINYEVLAAGPKTPAVTADALNGAVKTLNDARATLARHEQEKQRLERHRIARPLRKRKIDHINGLIRAARARVNQADATLKTLRNQQKQHEEEKRKAEEVAKAQREANERKRREEEARRRAPSPVAIDILAFDGSAWKGRKASLNLRDTSGKIVVADSNAQGQIRCSLRPGLYTADISQGIENHETSASISFECALGAPVSTQISIVPKWQEVELKACEAGQEVLLFGYLLQTLPVLPQVIDQASIDTDIPELVG